MNTTRSAELASFRAADEQIAAAYEVFHNINGQIAPLKKDLKTLPRYTWYTAEERAEKAAKLTAQIEALIAQAAEARTAAQALNDELYKGWSRFFLVQHIHSNMHCSSFRPTTRVGWLPSVSGLTEAEAVAEHGATLCTICFPSAPVSLTTKPVDESVCTGSWDRTQPDGTRYYSPWVTCTCGARVSITSTGKLRKHKKA